MPLERMETLAITYAPLEEVTASGLAAQLDADLLERYPGEPINSIDPVEFRASGGCFMIARLGSQAVGCGAFRPLDSDIVEIKRMFVPPAFRGRGIGRCILAALEAEARTRGHTTAILETAVRQPEAIALYRACGYAEIAPFGPYVESARSVCFGKTL
jgi:GNAT superfamily N-acetyltransferase